MLPTWFYLLWKVIGGNFLHDASIPYQTHVFGIEERTKVQYQVWMFFSLFTPSVSLSLFRLSALAQIGGLNTRSFENG